MPVELALEQLDLAAYIRPGDHILWGQGTAEPLSLTGRLVAQRHALGRVNVFLGTCFSDTLQPEHADSMAFSGIAGTGANRRLVKAGLLDIVPTHLSELPRLLAERLIPADVVLVQLSPEGEGGEFSLGVVNDYLLAAIAQARVVIAEVNDQTPWTYSEARLPIERVDVIVRTSRPMLELAAQPIGAVERRIGELIAGLVPDGGVLQLGIGAIPDAALAALSGHRRLGIHSGLIGNGVVDLIERGVITNESKAEDRGVSITGVAFGTRRLYDFVHRNKAVRFAPVTRTHAADVLCRIEKLISLNSAIEVDLTGQINAELVDGLYVGAIGGQVDFVRGAARSPGGRSIVAFGSTAGQGRISRIVARCRGGVITTARSDVDLVVTEYGVASLRGASLAERARRLIAIAHPDFREDLARAAHPGGPAAA